jgi:hypothetical protein
MCTNEPKFDWSAVARAMELVSDSSETGSDGSPMSYVSNDHDGLTD